MSKLKKIGKFFGGVLFVCSIPLIAITVIVIEGFLLFKEDVLGIKSRRNG